MLSGSSPWPVVEQTNTARQSDDANLFTGKSSSDERDAFRFHLRDDSQNENEKKKKRYHYTHQPPRRMEIGAEENQNRFRTKTKDQLWRITRVKAYFNREPSLISWMGTETGRLGALLLKTYWWLGLRIRRWTIFLVWCSILWQFWQPFLVSAVHFTSGLTRKLLNGRAVARKILTAFKGHFVEW